MHRQRPRSNSLVSANRESRRTRMVAHVSEQLATPFDDAGPSQPPRRDFLMLVTQASAAIGTAAIAWSLIDSMEPAADVIAAGAPMDIDLSKIAAGQQIIVLWRGNPVLIVNRTPSALKTLQDPQLVTRLSDPNSEAHQQPPYAENWHRSIKPEYAVLVGICTHLGCLPGYWPQPDPTTPVPNWPGGYFCPCHGSKYRPRRASISGRTGAVQSAGAAISFPQRPVPADRRESCR